MGKYCKSKQEKVVKKKKKSENIFDKS